ncbi:MAG: Hydrolase [Glaciihabitans sp.]|nr:Hydrolase [Glaciihabitans sp.]
MAARAGITVALAVVVGAAVIGAATLTAPHAATRSPAAASAGLQVVGYADASDTTAAQLNASRHQLTTVGIDGINLLPGGAGVEDVPAAASTLLTQTHALGKKAELLVGNFDSSLGDFSPELAASLLGSPANIHSVVGDLAGIVTSQGWDGITVDLEALTPDDTAGLSSLLAQLHAALPHSSISIALTATPGAYADLGYDLHAIDQYANHVVLMAYDQHGPTWSKAGPIGGTPWVKKSLQSLLDVVHASKVQLGIAGYGYSWPTHGTGRQYSDSAARALAKKSHVTAVWNSTQDEWHATLPDGTVLWWSSARTYAQRVSLAKQYKLGGVAVWSLGLSDPLK